MLEAVPALRFDRNIATNVEYRQRGKGGAITALRYKVRWCQKQRRNLIYT